MCNSQYNVNIIFYFYVFSGLYVKLDLKSPGFDCFTSSRVNLCRHHVLKSRRSFYSKPNHINQYSQADLT